MKKRMRIISLVLSCILIIGFVSLSYGADFEPITGAAFGFQSSAGIKTGTNDIKASATDPNGSSSNPYYVKPSSSNGTQYYYNGSSITNLGSIGATINSWGSLVSAISQSFAYSAKGIADAINNSSVFTWPSLNYTYSPTTSDNATNVNFSLGSSVGLQAINNQLTEMFRESWRFQYKILNNGVIIGNNSSNGFNQDYLWKKYLTAVSGSIPKLSSGGVYSTQSIDFSSMSILGAIEALLYYSASGTTNGISLLVRDVRDNNAALDDYLYDSDLNPTLIPRTTVWQNMRDFWTNISDHLAHLRYVLANDEDIQLRQQTVDQQTAYKTNFTASGASGRLSGSDIADTAAAGSELKSAFTSSASSRDAFNGFSAGTDGRWNWFSTEILNSLDTTTNNRKSNENLTNFLGDYYNEVIRYAD